jgi:hypothetical protein
MNVGLIGKNMEVLELPHQIKKLFQQEEEEVYLEMKVL